MRASLCSLTGLVLLPLLTACPTGPGDTDGGDTPEEQDITLSFAAHVNGDAFNCNDSFSGVGTGATDTSGRDMRLYVHDVVLLDADGNETPLTLTDDDMWQSAEVALLDFEDGTGACENGNAEMNSQIVGTAPAGTYEGVAFSIGVPSELNHQDVTSPDTEPPLNLSAMFWNWQGGYKFIRAEVVAGIQWNIHLGSTACTGDAEVGEVVSCSNRNSPRYELTGQDPTSSTIAFDLGTLLEASDLDANTADTPPGCMSAPTDPECPAVFDRLGLGEVSQSWVRWAE